MIELATAALRKFGELRLRVNGSSMLPAIRPDDVLSIRRCGLESVEVGEIVLFIRHQRLFAHRVISTAPSTLVTQGDAIGEPDTQVAACELLGRVVGVERRGKALLSVSTPTATARLASLLFRRSALAGRLFTRLNAAPLRAGA